MIYWRIVKVIIDFETVSFYFKKIELNRFSNL